jgi:hypothetical protein
MSCSLVVCVHEDRAECLPGVKLTVLSLARYAPSVDVVVNFPSPPRAFIEWMDRQSNARLVALDLNKSQGWNIKPTVLLKLLNTHEEVVWIDSDILLSGPVTDQIWGGAQSTLVAAQETYWGQEQTGTFRTEAWGFKVGRVIGSTINSGVVRVTREHRPLLEAWQRMLAHPAYQRAQAGPWYERPLHMVGDQEALTALLGSRNFSHLPLKLLLRGREIAQCFGPAGLTPGERFEALLAKAPFLVHAMGAKPWRRAAGAPRWSTPDISMAAGFRNYYEYVALDLSPYSILARQFAEQMEEDCGWMRPRSRIGRLLNAITGGNAYMAGLPLACIDHAARFMRRKLAIGRFSKNDAFFLKEPPI